MNAILERKKEYFILWRPAKTNPVPKLILCQFKHGNPPEFINEVSIELMQNSEHPELWELKASECGLIDGCIYHYWFEVLDSNPYNSNPKLIRCTDPMALTVDWRLTAETPGMHYGNVDCDPPGVIKYQNGMLISCDPNGEISNWEGDASINVLSPNNRLVIYELPTSWTRKGYVAGIEFGVGSFKDIMALIDTECEPYNFSSLSSQKGNAHITELGINALELLPPADSFVDREWGYATSNYFAPDYDLGFPKGNLSPTANRDLADLIKLCHKNKIRFFSDMVMAFATQYSYRNINFHDFHVQAGSGDPEEYTFDENGNKIKRDGFGGDLFKYNFKGYGYDPITGSKNEVYFARTLMFTFLMRWMKDFRIDGLRLDSVVNYGNWDFMQEFKDYARKFWRERAELYGLTEQQADDKFITVGEELAVPIEIIKQKRLDGLWNENFKRMVRYAILGNNDEKEPSFEWTIKKIIDCRLLGFEDGAQAVNYITSHDVEGYRNERIYNFLVNNNATEIEKRIKLAFVCLMTAVGIPMIFAGEEFADEHDLKVSHPQKQSDPVNFDRCVDPWRKEIFKYVSKLSRLRTTHDALSVNDTKFIHVDFNDGKRVIVWQRGIENSGNIIIVVANFSDFISLNAGNGGEYVVPNFPQPADWQKWHEVTQDRIVPREWAGREPIYSWEAKVYKLI